MSSPPDPPQHSRRLQRLKRIGDFQILRVLGEGGMGVVYEAEQEHPRRRVALKVIRTSRMTGEMLKRFEREAQVLGLLQHPGIAQIYQAGTADSGYGPEPYFAMELVVGRSLLEHAREERLDLQQRLALFARVCDAVQHAHQKGVVHRDLKPGNILVVAEDPSSGASSKSGRAASTTELDAFARVGQPKILDFGLARLTESDVPAVTLQTEIGQILGTVQYMSPEQVTGNSSHVDSRSDVYSLGVIGYELVSGRPPYELRGMGMLEALRTIREDTPASVSSIDRGLRGDVETILAKALEKDPAQRYPTAADMAADIRRYLRDEPIVARPPSTVYQLRKFAARNKVLVGGVIAVFVALLAGLIGTGLGILEARKNEAIAREKTEEARSRESEAVRSRDEATKARDEATRSRDEATRSRDEATKARAAADASAAEAQAINDFLVNDMLSAANPNVAKGQTITLEQVLENARVHADDAFKSQPLLLARLHKTLGEIDYRLGRASEAERHLRAAWDLRRERLGEDDDLTLEAKQDLGRTLSELGRSTEACDLLREIVDQRRAGHDDVRLASALCALAQGYKLGGDILAAQSAYDEALEIMEALPPDSHSPGSTLPALLADRASLYSHRRQYAEAQHDYERSLAIYRRMHGDVHPDVARVMGMLANTERHLGHLDKAATQMQAVLEMQRSLFSKDHPDIARTLSNLGEIAEARGDYAEAEARVREAIAMRSGLKGFDEYDLAVDEVTLAEILSALARHAEATRTAEQAIARLEKHAGTHEEQLASALFGAAIARRGTGDSPGSARAAERSLEIRRNQEVPDPKALAQSMSLVAQIHHTRKEYDQAEKSYREVLDLYTQLEGPNGLDVAVGHSNLGQLLFDEGKLEEAVKSLRASLETGAIAFAPDHPTLAAMRYNFARSLHRMHEDAEAVELLRTVLAVQRTRLPAGHNSTLNTLVLLGEVLTAMGKLPEAEDLLREAVEARRIPATAKSARFAIAASTLGACLVAEGRLEEAESLLLESQATWAALENEREQTALAAQRLAELYDKLGRAEDAARWRVPETPPR